MGLSIINIISELTGLPLNWSIGTNPGYNMISGLKFLESDKVLFWIE